MVHARCKTSYIGTKRCTKFLMSSPNEQSAPSLREKFIKNKDLNREHNLRSNDTDLALPKPKTNYLPSEAKKASSLYQFKCSMPTIPETRM